MSNDPRSELVGLLNEAGLEVQGITMRPRVLAVSNQSAHGLLFDGELEVPQEGFEPLTEATVRALRCDGVALTDGDWLIFPNAAPKHRIFEVGRGRLNGGER